MAKREIKSSDEEEGISQHPEKPSKSQEKEHQERTKRLAEDRKEVAKSAERTKEAARKAAEAIAQKVQKVSAGESKDLKDLSGEEQLAVVVESMPHLMVLPSEKVNVILAEQGARFRVDPKLWDNQDEAARWYTLKKNGVINTTKLPFIASGPEVIYEGNGNQKGLKVIQEDGKLAVVGSGTIEPSEIEKILHQAGVEVKLSKPKGWDRWSFQDKKAELLKQGVNVIPEISGGALPDIDEAGRVLSEREDVSNFTAAVDALRQAYDPTSTTYGQWDAPRGVLRVVIDRMRGNVERGENYYEVSKIAEIVNGLDISAKTPSTHADAINRFLSQDERNRILEMPNDLDRKLRDGYDGLDTDTKRAVFGDLDVAVDSAVKAMTTFGYRWDYQDQVKLLAKEMSARYPEKAHLIEWRVERARTDTNRKLLETLTKAPPTDWRDSRNNLAKLFRNVESLDYSIGELSAALNRGNAIVSEMPIESLQGKEKMEAELARQEMNEELEATQQMVQFFKTMEDESMNPEKVQEVFKRWKDTTLKVYFERFTKDEEGRSFSDNEKFPELRGEKLNLLDESLKVFMKRFKDERIEMNKVEEMTKRELRFGSGNAAEDYMIRYLAKKKLGKEWDVDISTLRSEMGEINKYWMDNEGKASNRKNAISEWYRTQKVLGAHGFASRDQLLATASETEKKVLEKMEGSSVDLMIFRKRILKQELQAVLMARGLSGEKMEKMDAVGLLDQVVNNGQKMAWNFAWSDYDGVRVWDMSANPQKLGGHDGRIVSYVYNQATGMFYGRAVDHLWEFYVDEARGEVAKTNIVFQGTQLGARGNFLPQNRTMVRFAGKFSEIIGVDLGAEVRARRSGFKNIDKLNMHDEDEASWARSAIVGEMIDSGELSFENANWSEMLGREDENISQYSMIDLYGDRAAHLKYTGAEVLQKYLQQPDTKFFLKINSLENFYSRRPVRIKPWMKLAIPGHQEIGKHWKEWYDLPHNMPNAEVEDIIEESVKSNRLDVHAGHEMRLKYLGALGVPGFLLWRRLIQEAQIRWVVGKEQLKHSWVLLLLIPLGILKSSFEQAQSQLQGK